MSKSIVKPKPASRRGTRATSSLARKANRVIDRADRKTEGKIQSISTRLKSGIAGVRTRAKGVVKAVGNQASRADKAIRAKPYQSIGIAAGTALVAGYLMARRKPAPAPAAV